MVWVEIILGILQALPGLISLIQEIIAGLKDHPNAASLGLELEHALMHYHLFGGTVGVLESRLIVLRNKVIQQAR